MKCDITACCRELSGMHRSDKTFPLYFIVLCLEMSSPFNVTSLKYFGQRRPPGDLSCCFLRVDYLLINHLGLTSRPRRQRWIEVLSGPIATKTRSNRCASGGQRKPSRCINAGISHILQRVIVAGKCERVHAMSLCFL